VPREFIRDGQIVLNLGMEATNKLQIGNDLIEFQARFGGVARQLSVPVSQVSAIYARENGAGMAFEVGSDDLASDALEVPETEPEGAVDENPEPPRPDGGRPKLQRIK
jgi:stringent starvation protein B